jgi:hypothetical protein
MKFKSVLLAASLIAFGCHQKTTLAEPHFVKTVNGEIYYFFNKDGEMAFALKSHKEILQNFYSTQYSKSITFRMNAFISFGTTGKQFFD